MNSLLTLNKCFFKYKYRLIGGIIFVCISNYFAIYPAQLVREAFDLVQSHLFQISSNSNKAILREILSTAIFKFSILILLMALLKGLFMFLMRQAIITMSRLIERDLKTEIFEHYLKLDAGFYKKNNTGDLMNRISEDVSRVRMYVGPALMYIVNLISTFVMVIYTMINVNATLTFYLLIPLPILSWLIYKVSAQIEIKSDLVQEQLSELSSNAQETFSGIRIVKGFSKENYWSQKFKIGANEYKKRALALAKIDAAFTPAVGSIIGLSSIIIIYVGGNQVLAGKISTGNIAEFFLYVNMLIWPVTSLGWVSSLIQRAAVSQKRINEFLLQEPKINASIGINLNKIEDEIIFKEVSYTYPDTGIKALQKINFTIKKGKSLGIIGQTGSGKSTIAGLLLRIYDPSQGNIFLDQNNLKELHLGNYRKLIGYVSQDVFLFSESIKENIAYGLNFQSSDRDLKIITAAKQACIFESIQEFPDQFETVVGERGVTLSGGQKQRISIARAIIKNPEILLFDDCLSAVDTETEAKILENLKNIRQEKTSIIISHRISSVKNCDEIIVLEAGEIVEKGTHFDLMRINQKYAATYLHQTMSKEHTS